MIYTIVNSKDNLHYQRTLQSQIVTDFKEGGKVLNAIVKLFQTANDKTQKKSIPKPIKSVIKNRRKKYTRQSQIYHLIHNLLALIH